MWVDLYRSFGSVPLNCIPAEDYDTPMSSLLDSSYLVSLWSASYWNLVGICYIPNCEVITKQVLRISYTPIIKSTWAKTSGTVHTKKSRI